MNSKKSKIKYEKSSERKKARIISNKKPNKESNKESEKKVKKEIRKKTSEKTSEKNDKGVKKNPNNEYKKLSEERKRWYC